MASPYVGQITAFAFPFAPAGWAFCAGSTVPMNQYGALFALIGNTFGGNGSTTIGLPNLAGTSPCGAGSGPGLTPRTLGQSFGTAAVTLDVTTMPPHTHTAQAVPFSRTAQPSPTPNTQSGLTVASTAVYSDGAPDLVMGASAVTPAGMTAAHNNQQPYLAINYCIALRGNYPYFN